MGDAIEMGLRCHYMHTKFHKTGSGIRKLLWENFLQGIHVKQLTTENMYDSAIGSMGPRIKSAPGNGPRCFRMNGQICHFVSSL
jgi:hypothetical protein